MEVIFECPTFFAQEDEEQFFNWIYELAGFQKARGVGLNLHLHFQEQLSDETVKSLLIIFYRWRIDIAALLILKTSSNADFCLWQMDL